MEQRSAAGDNESRLLGSRDDLDLEPDLHLHAGKEVLAIGRTAARFGGDIARRGDPARRDFRGADPQRVEGTLDRVLGERAGCRQPLAQSHNTGKRVENTKADTHWPGDQQPTIVRSEIECRELRSEARCDRRRVRGRQILSGGMAGRQRSDCLSDRSFAAGLLLHGRRTILLSVNAMLTQLDAKSKGCQYRRGRRRATQQSVVMVSGTVTLMGDRLTVGQRTLTPPV